MTHSKEERRGIATLGCGKWRDSKLSNAKSVAKTPERNAAAEILSPIYHSVEHSFAGYIHQGCHLNERMSTLRKDVLKNKNMHILIFLSTFDLKMSTHYSQF